MMHKEWSEVIAVEDDKSGPPLIVTEDKSYNIEAGRNNVIYNSRKLIVENAEQDIPYYARYFFGKEHLVFMNDGTEDTDFGAFILVIGTPNGSDTKGLLLTSKNDFRFVIPAEKCKRKKDMLQYVKTLQPELAHVKLHVVNPALCGKEICDYEVKTAVKAYKFGVIYVSSGQTVENDFYSNIDGSKQFEDFMDMMGEKIRLKGWDKYSGGLNIDKDLNGTHAVYTKVHDDFEVIFHVSTWLPYVATDPQRIERKRHIGNDAVVVIFKEGSQPFDPTTIKSHFNHVFFVVELYKDSPKPEERVYRIAVVSKPGVPPFGPYLPSPALFTRSEATRLFLVTKLINAERASMSSPLFINRIRAKNVFLSTIAKDTIPKGPPTNLIINKADMMRKGEKLYQSFIEVGSKALSEASTLTSVLSNEVKDKAQELSQNINLTWRKSAFPKEASLPQDEEEESIEYWKQRAEFWEQKYRELEVKCIALQKHLDDLTQPNTEQPVASTEISQPRSRSNSEEGETISDSELPIAEVKLTYIAKRSPDTSVNDDQLEDCDVCKLPIDDTTM